MMRILNFCTSPSLFKQLRHSSSSSHPALQAVAGMQCSGVVEKQKPENRLILELENKKHVSKEKGNIVKAAFEKLKTLNGPIEMDDPIFKMIEEAKELDALLNIVTIKRITKQHALKVVSVLADWTVEGKIQTSDFETDSRFVSVCSVLGSTLKLGSSPKTVADKTNRDYNTVLSVTSDDEAAKLISNISLSQMIKVLSTLASKKRRSTPLLRALAFNISSTTEKLDIKQGADALYAVASLNYHDEILVERVCTDLCSCLMSNSRRAVVRSIITSLGLLRYKHIGKRVNERDVCGAVRPVCPTPLRDVIEGSLRRAVHQRREPAPVFYSPVPQHRLAKSDLLNLLCDWVQAHQEVCVPQDLTSLLMTLAVVDHLPANQDTLFPMILEQLSTSGLSDPHQWLDVVWALTVLNKESAEHVSSVLSPEFIDKLRAIHTDGLTVAVKLKLLNINGVAKLRMKDYKGPLLHELSSEEWKCPLLRSKEKQTLVTAVQETMMNLLPSAHYLGTNIDTDMGFIIDAECLMTTKFTPLPLFDKKTKERIDRSGPDTQKGIKVAVLVWDYHDMTRGRREPTGVSKLCQEVTRLKGYRVVVVDYLDFNPQSKLVTRVQYLNRKLRGVIDKC